MTKRPYYNRTNTCDRCGEKLKIGKYGNIYREYSKEGNWTGKWLCKKCRRKDVNNESDVYKSLAGHRTGNLDPNSSFAKGDLFEELTDRWRGVKRLSIENDNYTLPFDHSVDPELGVIQTRGKLYDPWNRKWLFGNLEKEHYKEFDNYIFYCADEYGDNIERIYIIPKKEIIKRTGISVCKSPSRGGRGKRYKPWYDKYRVKEEEILKMINKIWRDIIKKKKVEKQ